MRGDLLYQRVMEGHVIDVLLDELGRNYVTMVCVGYDTALQKSPRQFSGDFGYGGATAHAG